MQKMRTLTLSVLSLAFLASCQSSPEVKLLLTKTDTQTFIMESIAEDSVMAKRMVHKLINSEQGKRALVEHHTEMMTMMKDDARK